MDNRTKVLFLFVFVLLFPTMAHADVNVETRRSQVDQHGLFGDIQVNGSFQYGNTKLINIGASGILGYRTKKHEFLGFGGVAFTTESIKGRAIQKTEMFHTRYSYRIIEPIWWETFTQIEEDQNVLIDLRYLVGTGPRFIAYNQKNVFVAVGTSYMPELEILNSSISEPFPSNVDSRKNWFHRINYYYSFSYDVADNVSLQSSLYFQPRVDRPKDFKVFGSNAIAIEANDVLQFVVNAGLRYDNEPPTVCNDECARLSKLDISVSLGVRANF